MIPSVLPTYNRAPLSFVSGEGSWLVEQDGRRFLDFGAGIAVNALGHAHPDLVQALTDQAGKLWHVSNLYQIEPQQRLADMLVDKTFADTVFFTNSGTESCELAVKMARKYRHDRGEDRPVILTFEGSFHGRSSAGIAAAGSEKMTRGFGPCLPGFQSLPWGDHEALKSAAAQPDVGAILIEPVQGEGGIRPLPDQCLEGLRELCDEHGLLLILDEVQCGMGRTGKLFAHEWAGVNPDIMMVAKGIGGGFPLGAVLATEKAAQAMTAGSHGSTYGGNPLACAVGCKVMEIVADDAFLSQVIPYQDSELEQFYTFCRNLISKLPPPGDGSSFTLDDEVALKYFRIQQMTQGSIDLGDGETDPLKGPTDVGSGGRKDEEVGLRDLVERLNERFGTSFTRADQLFFEQVRESAESDDRIVEAALANKYDNFSSYLERMLDELFIDRMDGNEEVFSKVMSDQPFRAAVHKGLARELYERIRSSKQH